MRRWWRSHSVRVRLTLWYVAAMVVVLAVYAAVVFAFVSRNMSETLEGRLRGDFQWASAMVDQTPEGGITWYEDTHRGGVPGCRCGALMASCSIRTARRHAAPCRRAGTSRSAPTRDRRASADRSRQFAC